MFDPSNNDRQHMLDRLSTAIGRNTQLKALVLDGLGINDALAMNFLRGIACNQSIKRFHFYNCEEYFGNACRILTPLFKNNQVERIRICACKLSPESTRLLATSLAEFDSLKEFALTDARLYISQQAARELMQSLSGHSRLGKLDLSSNNIGKLGCSALVDDLLSKPNINLRVLDLTGNALGDAEVVALPTRMAGNASLKEINLRFNRDITQAGWQAFFNALSSSGCRLEKLKLGGNNINDAAAQSLSNALASNTTIKTLDLGFTRGITPTGWRVLFGAIHSPTCVLEDLYLGNDLNDEVMSSLTDALASNRSLKSLNLYDNFGVTGVAWQRFFSATLANPSSGLEKLDLDYCGINDAAIEALTNALVNNSKLKVINLSQNNQITNAGWEMLSTVLDSPHTALEELYLGENEMNDATCTVLLNFLANNKKLKKLIFDHSDY